MRRYSKVLFNIGDYGEVTVREFIFGTMLLAIYVICGLWIYGKIVNKINTHNSKYGNAYFIQNNETFKQAYEVEQDADVFVYGKLESVGSVNFNDWKKKRTYNCNDSGLTAAGLQANGNYSYIEVEKEHYTMHTRTVHYTVNGKSHTRTEHYYTWDTQWNRGIHTRNIRFCDVSFVYGTINFCNFQQVGFNRQGSDRYTIRAYPASCEGIAFLNIKNKYIGTGNKLYQYQNTVEDCEKLRQSFYMGNGWLIAFWIVFIAIGIALFLAWAYLDNDWLNNL